VEWVILPVFLLVFYRCLVTNLEIWQGNPDSEGYETGSVSMTGAVILSQSLSHKWRAIFDTVPVRARGRVGKGYLFLCNRLLATPTGYLVTRGGYFLISPRAKKETSEDSIGKLPQKDTKSPHLT